MKKNSLQLTQERDGLFEEHRTLAGKDTLTADEQTRFDALPGEIEAKDADIKTAEGHERITGRANGGKRVNINTNGKPSDEKDEASYSISRAIRVAAGLEKGGVEAELAKDGEREIESLGKTAQGFVIPERVLSRASSGQNVTTAADGGNLVQEEPLYFYDALKNKLVLVELGANFMGGLRGNLPLVGGGAFAASFLAEGDAVSITKESISKALMTPKRLSAAGALSKQLLAQSSIDAQRMVTDAIIAAIAEALQLAAINGSGSGANPTGVLNTSGIGSIAMGDNGAAIDWASLIKLETEVQAANASGAKMAYLTNSKVVGALKTLPRVSGGDRFIMENGMANGFNVVSSNSVPSNLTKGTASEICSAAIFGAWDKMHIGTWGGLDIVVDPYTSAKKSEIEIVINQYADVAVENAKHFAAIKDILT